MVKISLTSGILFIVAHNIWNGNGTNAPFIDPLIFADPGDWFWFFEGELSSSFAAFTMGFILGFSCMIGDMCGSCVKRRRGLKREGDESSEAPLLDTIPFAIAIFATAFLLLPKEPVPGSGDSQSSSMPGPSRPILKKDV